ncbi:MAG: AraC family transcriptional regulator [Capsulimonas sp.]|uniref:AraC family transcriptional regulator n=1 Tax=Capsulimonas sp. TaxID=2494211 RepID=UPI00326476EB
MKTDNYGVHGFQADLITVAAGVIERPAVEFHSIGINVSAPARVRAMRDGLTDESVHETLAIDIAPAGMPSRVEVEWTRRDAGDVLFLRLTPEFLERVASQCEWDAGGAEIRNEFRFRDPQIERLGLLFHADLEAGRPSGNLYGGSLATAFGVHLLRRYADASKPFSEPRGGLGAVRMRRVLEHIETHLADPLTLTELADAAGLGASQFRILFKQSLGLSPHRYVTAQRVDWAKDLLLTGGRTLGQVASDVGFADQSHLTRHMRRHLGVTPGVLARRAPTRDSF